MVRAVFRKDQFLAFCRAFDHGNDLFDFETSEVVEDEAGNLEYQTIYRDPDNYKSPVVLKCTKGDISWDVLYGYEEAYEELESLYVDQVRQVVQAEGLKIAYTAPDSEPRQIFCPRCGEKAAETSDNFYFLDEEKFEDENTYLYEGEVERFVCNACQADFYVTEEISGRRRFDMKLVHFKDQNVLLFEGIRVPEADRDPELHYYELRHGDDPMFPVSIETGVFVNFWGTMIAKRPVLQGDQQMELPKPLTRFLAFNEDYPLHGPWQESAAHFKAGSQV